ncbi:MAG: TVP38/TMEM64 family protein [Pseudomonadota bacterium]
MPLTSRPVPAVAGNLRIALLAVLALAVGAFFYFDVGRFLNLEALQAARASLSDWVAGNPLLSRGGFFLVYVLAAAFSLPGAAILTLAAGALFGLWWGFALVSFASAIGATLAMLIARKIVGEWVQQRYQAQLAKINAGLERDGGFYLFSLRMVPLFPFFVINLVMGLTRMGTWPFYWISQIGMVPGTLVFVFAGTQLAEIESIGDVLSPGLIAAFTLLGLFPVAARMLMSMLRPVPAADLAAGNEPARSNDVQHGSVRDDRVLDDPVQGGPAQEPGETVTPITAGTDRSRTQQ